MPGFSPPHSAWWRSRRSSVTGRGLEDATGERRARLLFDVGNALVQECRGEDAALLDRAIRSYKQCLRQDQASAELIADARHNLDLVRALRERAAARKKDRGAD